jgi:hypothetical protein
MQITRAGFLTSQRAVERAVAALRLGGVSLHAAASAQVDRAD